MLKILIIFFILHFYKPVFSFTKEDVISQMQLTNNLSFNFIQTINDKSENGECIVEYPKKIWCKYIKPNKKIIISNGKSLIIKTANQRNYSRYLLKKTPLEFLLDKKYLISKIKTLKPINIDDKYLGFRIIENNNEINIFFDKKTLNLIGWQTEDIYQNLTITFISSVKINQNINVKIFNFPKSN